MRHLNATIFLAALFVCINLGASERPDGATSLPVPCEHLLSNSLNVELSRAGSLIGESGLAGLPDEKYVYMIDVLNRIIVSPRVPDVATDLSNPDATFLATHRSLHNELRELAGGIDYDVISAGEFVIINGRVAELNNKSGRWRGDHTHLNYAKEVLSARGLPIEPFTRLADYSKNVALPPRSHATEAEAATYLIRYHDNAEFLRLAEMYKRLADKFPNSTLPGRANTNAIKLYLQKKEAQTRTRREYAFTVQILAILRYEELPFVFHVLTHVERFPVSAFMTYVEQMILDD